MNIYIYVYKLSGKKSERKCVGERIGNSKNGWYCGVGKKYIFYY